MRWTRSACMFLKLNLARSPERVLMPLKGCIGYTLHRESANELRVVPKIVGDSHVFDARVVGSGQNLEEVEVLRIAGHRVPGVLKRAQLHLGLEGVRRELAAIAGVLKIGALAEQIVGVPEGDEGTEQFCESSSHRHVVGGAAGGDAGDLRVHCGIRENQAAPLVAFVQCRIEGDLAREDPDVFDGVIRRTLTGAQGVRGLTKFQLIRE